MLKRYEVYVGAGEYRKYGKYRRAWKCRGDKKSGKRWVSVSKRPSTLSHPYSFFFSTLHIPTYPYISLHIPFSSPILIIHTSQAYIYTYASYTYASYTYPSHSHSHSHSPILIRYYSKVFFTLPIPHKHIHILTKYINWTTIQLLLPIVSSKNSHNPYNPIKLKS